MRATTHLTCLDSPGACGASYYRRVKMRTVLYWMLGAAMISQGVVCACGQTTDSATKAFVQKAVNNELAKDRADHTTWLYYEVDQKPDHPVKQWVAMTHNGSLKRILAIDGRKLSPQEQRDRVNRFLSDNSIRAKQRKSNSHDDKQATQMLQMLPNAFIWTRKGEEGDNTILHFRPDPNFDPPNFEAKVFAAMEGDMAVNTKQLRIASLKGRLTQDVKIWGGVLGQLNSGGTFDVERRETGDGVWQITETHVHINGHALIFKTISEQEDDVKSEFKELPPDITLQQAKNELFDAGKQNASAKSEPSPSQTAAADHGKKRGGHHRSSGRNAGE